MSVYAAKNKKTVQTDTNRLKIDAELKIEQNDLPVGSASLLLLCQCMGLGGVPALPAPQQTAERASAWGSLEASLC